MKYEGHKYTWTNSFKSVRHHWELRTVHGGIHFSASCYDGNVTCGLEMHSIYPHGDNAPDHVNCPITGGRCWHDGTSLYATESLWPLIQPYQRIGDHEAIFKILEEESNRLAEYAPAPINVMQPAEY